VSRLTLVQGPIPPRSILLIRHGETVANASRVVQLPDAPLSEHGVRQAARLAIRLASYGVEAVVSSDFARARITAEQICAATAAPVNFLPELRERNFGILRGRPYSECPDDIFAPDYVPPQGEAWDEFHARVARAWSKVTALALEMRGNIAVVTHGLVCRSIVERLVGLGDLPAPAHWPNASLTIISAEAPHRLKLLNCTEHLADLAPRHSPQGGPV
jgi:probable phosphoglycerate mutase